MGVIGGRLAGSVAPRLRSARGGVCHLSPPPVRVSWGLCCGEQGETPVGWTQQAFEEGSRPARWFPLLTRPSPPQKAGLAQGRACALGLRLQVWPRHHLHLRGPALSTARCLGGDTSGPLLTAEAWTGLGDRQRGL